MKLHLPEERDVGISYRRLLLHDTTLMEDAHRTGLRTLTLLSVNVVKI